ncbi:hypothetical protein DRN75_02575 [Nanoarchaeota archaeon]|nr:MAG: hypothetical protein DRN75_02575 [Nanoarchaeota archaeon]
MVEDNIKFGVGMSQKWDPKKAGVEATNKAIEQVGYKPKFLLIFSTIHYAKEKGGLKSLLKGCRRLIDDNVPSIGGTVTGFICPEGCFTHGVVVVAGSGDIDVSADYGEKVIYNPTSIGRKIGKTISRKLKDSKKRNKLLIEFTTGPTEPTWIASPRIYNFIKYFYKKLPLRISWFLRDLIINTYIALSPSGPGMEEDVLYAMSEPLNKYYLIGCSTFDDMASLKHYQFLNSIALKDSTVALGLSLNNKIILDRKLSLISLGKKFKIKKGWKDFCIDLINNQPASTQYLREMGWPRVYMEAHIEQVTKKTFYYPLGFKDNDQIYTFPVGFFFGESIVSNRKIRKDEVELFLTSSKKTLEDVENYLKLITEKKTKFTLIIKGAPMIGVFGAHINVMKKIMDYYLNNSPYLMLFGSGEHSKKPNEKAIFNNFSTVMLSILEPKEVN